MFFGYKNKQKFISKVYFSKFTRQIIKEISGFTNYERNIMELIKMGRDKKALKIAKKSLGNINRAKKKKEFLNAFLKSKKI